MGLGGINREIGIDMYSHCYIQDRQVIRTYCIPQRLLYFSVMFMGKISKRCYACHIHMSVTVINTSSPHVQEPFFEIEILGQKLPESEAASQCCFFGGLWTGKEPVWALSQGLSGTLVT